MWSKFILLVWHVTSKLRIYHNLVKDHWNPTGSSTSKYITSQQGSFHNLGHTEFHRPNAPDAEGLTMKNRQMSWIKPSLMRSGDTTNKNSCPLKAGVSNGKTTSENNLAIPHTYPYGQTSQPSKFMYRYTPQKILLHVYNKIHSRMLTAPLFAKTNYNDNQKSKLSVRMQMDK